MFSKEINDLIKEFRAFRSKNTATCKAIRVDEVAQFVLYKQNKGEI